MLIFDALAYCFRDPRWAAKSLSTTFSYLFIVPPFGYATRITQHVSRGQDKGLPDHDFAAEFVMGAGILLVALLYQIPTFVIYRLTFEAITPSVTRLNAMGDLSRSLNEISALMASIAGVSLAGWLLVQFFGFFFWVGFVLWAANGKVTSFFDLPTIFALIREQPGLLIANYVQQFVTGLLVYALTTISSICICLPFFFIPFYTYVYGYITGKTAKALNLRAAAPGELRSDFTGDI